MSNAIPTYATRSEPFIGNCQFKTQNDILEASKYPLITTRVDDQVKLVYKIDVNQTLQQFAHVGPDLQLAYMETNGFKSGAKIAKVIASYQKLINTFHATCQTSVTASLLALQYHVEALKIADQDPILALRFLEHCKNLAENMEKESGILKDEIKQLCQASDEAVDVIYTDEPALRQRQEYIKKGSGEMKAKIAALEEEIRLLSVQMEEIVDEVSKRYGWNKRAREDINHFFREDTRMWPLYVRREEKRKDLFSAERYLRDSLQKDNLDLSTVLDSLESVMKSFHNMKTVFENTRIFWKRIKASFEAFKDDQIIRAYCGAEMTQNVIEEIKLSLINWLSLAKVHILASAMLQPVIKINYCDICRSDFKDLQKVKLTPIGCINELKGHTDWVRALAVLPDGTLVSGSCDKTIKLWDLNKSKESKTLKGHTNDVCVLAALPGGILASGSKDKTIKLWDPHTGKELKTLKGHTGMVHTLAVLPDGTLASQSEDETIKLWELNTGKELQTLKGHTHSVLLSDGTLASQSENETIKLWDLCTGKELQTLKGHIDAVFIIAHLPHGVCSSGSNALLPDGIIASGGSWDNTIKLWDPHTNMEQLILKGHTDTVCALAVLPDGTLVSGSWDRTIRLWK